MPYRQWVLTLPRWLRLPVARDAKVLSAVHRIFVTKIERAYLATTALDARDRGPQRHRARRRHSNTAPRSSILAVEVEVEVDLLDFATSLAVR